MRRRSGSRWARLHEASSSRTTSKKGVLHIWTDSITSCSCSPLLLPAVLVRSTDSGKRWAPAPSFKASFTDVFKVVTAFTVAHSITLSLAALGVISLPSRLVESAIAVSVVLAALNNVRSVVYEAAGSSRSASA
jgi:hypothetical protein